MVRTSYASPIRKRPRPKQHKFYPVLSRSHNECSHNGLCNNCMDDFQAEVDRDRPGHLWRVEDGKLHYKEDDAIENHLGRKLAKNESVIMKNDKPGDCRIENLEVVIIPDMEY
jgi:hypothetical protein